MRGLATAVLLLAALQGCATAGAAKPAWTVFADCAAAYRVNAAVADPDRPASMAKMVSEVADDYEKAARARYLETAHGSPADAQRSVSDRVAASVKTFGGQPRVDVEHVIDACPQT